MSKDDEIDLVSSRVYPGLERSPGRNDNWVEQTGGLPKYIERIAKHLHYEQGYSISRSIAVAVNTVKRWALGGTVTAHGTTKRITPATQAKAIKAVAEWEAKKARAHLNLSVDLAVLSPDTRKSLASKGAALPDGSFPIRNVEDLRNAIRAIGRAKDPAKAKAHIKKRARALHAANLIPDTWDLSEGGTFDQVIDLALTKDGRKSFKRQGKWGHGFVPLDAAAKRAKAKGSPIAAKRINRLYGNAKRGSSDLKGTLKSSKSGATEHVDTGRAAQARHALTPESSRTQRLATNRHQVEHSKGGGITARASKPWTEIAEADKTIRNGKRYVRSVYRGKEQLVEWIGASPDQAAPDTAKRVLVSLRRVDAERMTTAQLRRALKTPGQPASVKKVLNATLKAKASKKKETS